MNYFSGIVQHLEASNENYTITEVNTFEIDIDGRYHVYYYVKN
ncbi:hypothetical protein [Flavivirga jejuensis]|uniref:Uncharacterized protein n=1 Tax=Flavivirga jejuensis TaxID=870487 RepID=A0ABT8WK13_9FLAO|nr:hypothetical protein [Flavivirga jejuensis]MDO5973475.1 hypothetical protein [Flavivirga jejuensis]